MTEYKEIASGLQFPVGPVAMPDGSVLLVEIAAGRLSRVSPDGTVSVVAETGGGPNGAAIGPDGRCYICNNGGMHFHIRDGMHLPGHAPEDAPTGWIEAVNLETGKSEVLYRECGGQPLRAPNDLVFDAEGGLWFTDHGKSREHSRDKGGVYYAKADGYHLFDSLAVDSGGNVCVGSIPGNISVVSPDGQRCEDIAMPDPFPTNICFGGPDLKTAYITLSGAGN